MVKANIIAIMIPYFDGPNKQWIKMQVQPSVCLRKARRMARQFIQLNFKKQPQTEFLKRVVKYIKGVELTKDQFNRWVAGMEYEEDNTEADTNSQSKVVRDTGRQVLALRDRFNIRSARGVS